ncbi:hypothetical protein [methanotrophic endosymbiont of Bathymodiolus puteoserpentis (Logatchev)]|jgi:hypothetical protein|uniref:hypothetical protein n=1 Tax=methanotrophic endosymbiont of Bathymodiolus puteoserpentis (Logatchev) TaxID=343235 RepID=UPI0013C9374D|nr:hypothetical protein [methanotrophic endosymbiont of Bathymodiolus puteoserpentis (Logatchev)]SHE19333.1 hypothetical protein BPUTEOMOX_2676 [methanotrophic endosymbiont of Bathymodiolus puteoserpentis (Logatchev)]
MKLFYAVIAVGLILFYFIDIAFHIDSFSLEMLTHKLVRFFVGFGILGIWGWYEQKIEIKIALYIVLVLLVSDDIFDYFRNVDSLSLEMIIHDVLIITWGAVAGFFFMRHYDH